MSKQEATGIKIKIHCGMVQKSLFADSRPEQPKQQFGKFLLHFLLQTITFENHRIVQKSWPNNWGNTYFWGIRICVMTIRLSKMPAKSYLEEGRGLVEALLIYSLKLQRFVEMIDIFERIFKIRHWFNLSSISASCRKCTELQYRRSSWSSWSSCTLLWRQSESR